jgi:hypothetical protein
MDQYRMIEGKDFIAFLSGFLSFIKKVVRYTLLSIKDHFIVFIATLVVIIGAGLWYWHNAKVFFEAEMTCSFKDQTKKTYGEMIHNLGMLAQDQSYGTLAGMLHLSLPQAQSIISIEGKNMAGSMLYEDITMGQEPFYVYVKASNNTVFAHLQPALLTYLNTGSPYMATRRQQDSAESGSKIQYLNGSIAAVDSTIAAYDTMLTRRGDTDIQESRFVALLDYKNKLDSQISDQKRKEQEQSVSVEILHGFAPLEHPADERNKNIKLTILAAVILACFVSVSSKVIHDIKANNKNKNTMV